MRIIKRRRSPASRRASRGAALAEAALTLLAFMVTLFGIIEAARVVAIQQTLVQAVRAGSRLSVAPITRTTNLASEAEVRAEVQRYLQAAAVSGATVTVQPIVDSRGDELTQVTATVPYQLLSFSFFSDVAINLTATSAMRNETSP